MSFLRNSPALESLLIGGMRCTVHEQLEKNVEATLAKLVDVVTLQLELFRSRNYPHCMEVDKRLENLVGEKERAIGALGQHMREHKCQTAEGL